RTENGGKHQANTSCSARSEQANSAAGVPPFHTRSVRRASGCVLVAKPETKPRFAPITGSVPCPQRGASVINCWSDQCKDLGSSILQPNLASTIPPSSKLPRC